MYEDSIVRFLSLEPEREGRDRSNGRFYRLMALVNGIENEYIINVHQAVSGIDESGRPLWDLQFENTGGYFPDIEYIERINGSRLSNGEAGYIMDEWKRQYYTDPELLEEAKRYGDPDIIDKIERTRKEYQ
ncbi:MAG: hypothetical protein AABW46_02565 [Nanoarchaeota archaeon]